MGTDTGGSICGPSTANGIVGLQPTHGLLSRSGIIPLSLTFDTGGPMARSVNDVAVVLGSMTGIDPADSATKKSEGRFSTDYTKDLKTDVLKGTPIGIARDFLGVDPDVDWVIEASFEAMRKAGSTIVDASQAVGNWPPGGAPSLQLAGPNTVILLLSSAALVWAERSGARRASRGRLLGGLAVAFVLGCIFVGIQLAEWSSRPFSLSSGTYGRGLDTFPGSAMRRSQSGRSIGISSTRFGLSCSRRCTLRRILDRRDEQAAPILNQASGTSST
jgi:hypothetical protein